MKRTILVVDDDESLRHLVSHALTREGYDVIDLPNGRDAILQLTQVKFHAAIIELRMPDMAGANLIHVINRMCPDTAVIALTTMVGDGSRFQNIVTPGGVLAYLKKPCKLEELMDTLWGVFAGRLTSGYALAVKGNGDTSPKRAEAGSVMTRLSSVLQ
jgi:DNA-binding NtrC family response regulator